MIYCGNIKNNVLEKWYVLDQAYRLCYLVGFPAVKMRINQLRAET